MAYERACPYNYAAPNILVERMPSRSEVRLPSATPGRLAGSGRGSSSGSSTYVGCGRGGRPRPAHAPPPIALAAAAEAQLREVVGARPPGGVASCSCCAAPVVACRCLCERRLTPVLSRR